MHLVALLNLSISMANLMALPTFAHRGPLTHKPSDLSSPLPPHAVLCCACWPRLFAALLQDPVAADKLTKIQKDLDETKVILHQTIDSVLRRGEKLDTLVDKSADLSLASQMFYKQARKTNSCCRMS